MVIMGVNEVLVMVVDGDSGDYYNVVVMVVTKMVKMWC